MTKIKISFLCTAILFYAAACQQTKKPRYIIAESKTYEASLFRQRCALCHGSEGEGKMVNGKLVPSLRRGDVKSKDENTIYNQIKNGGNGMIPFGGQLSEKELQMMVKFIKHDLQDPD